MRLRTLGELSLEGSAFKRAKPLLMLAYLAVEGPKERWFLQELFYRGSKNAQNSLSTALARLRKASPDAVGAGDTMIWCEAACDAKELLEALDHKQNEKAVELYRGPFLAGVDPSSTGVEIEEWIYATRESFGARVRQALLELAEDHASVGEFTLGAEMAQRAYLLAGAPEPEAEELERLFVLLQAGEHGEAFEVRKEARAFDLDLSMSIEEARAALQKDAGTTTSEVGHNLPVQPTRFVGRLAEKAKLGALLADPDCRLLSIMGPGGMGKTRLAIEVAREQLEGFPDGVFFVPFAHVTSPTSMPYAIADALGVSSGGDVTKQLLAYLKQRQVLLVLDNLEHLLGGTDLIHDLWERTQSVKLLVTSRERLNLHAERVFVLSGLSSPGEVPVEQSDAVQLFLQTAANRGHEVTLSESSTPAVVRICQLAGDMPLAIELAASWLPVLPPEGIAEQLEQGLDVLESSTRDLPARHHSIRAVFDYSWELLSEVERGVLRRLSVFRGGFSLGAATVIAGASLPVLASLESKSFVTLTRSGRYEQHPLVLEYARERLAEQPDERADTIERHGLYYLGLLREHYSDLSSRRYKEARKLFDAEQPNILASWEWAVSDRRLGAIKDSAFPLHKVLEVQDREQEAVELFSQAADRLDESNPEHRAALGYVLIGQGAVPYAVGVHAETARGKLERGVELLRPLGEELGVALALSWLGNISALVEGDVAQARAYHQEGFPMARRTGSAHLIGRYLNQQLIVADPVSGGNFEDARKLREQILREMRAVGDPYSLAWVLADFGDLLIHYQSVDEGKALLAESRELSREYSIASVASAGLAEAALLSGDLDEAEAYASEWLQVARDVGYDVGEFSALAQVGAVATRRGNLPEAEGFLLEALRIARGIGNPGLIPPILAGLAELRIAQGRAAGAVEYLSFIIHHPATVQVSALLRPPMERVEAQGLLDGLRDQVPPEEFAVAVERGKEQTLDDVMNSLLLAI